MRALPSLQMVVLCVLVAVAPRPARADDALARERAAQDEYTAGRESYATGLYGRALEFFEHSLARVTSPNTRLYLARTLRELGRWADAAEHYRTTIAEAEARGGRYVATRDAARVELGDVLARLEHASSAVAPVPMPEMTATPTRVVEASPPAPIPTPAPTALHGPSAVTWTAGGTAAVGGVAFAVLYALASDRYAYLESHCAGVRDGTCDGARATGKTEETVAYVSLGVAVVAAATAVVSIALPRARSSGSAASLTPRTSWPLAF